MRKDFVNSLCLFTEHVRQRSRRNLLHVKPSVSKHSYVFSLLSQECSRLVTIASCLLMVTHKLHPVKAVLFTRIKSVQFYYKSKVLFDVEKYLILCLSNG